ncbi:MAG: prepilin-type N-terminal cleavage/methylation domain-containing protein [Candidatus Omnitrophota bacterium]|nr:prepilin-type N-terminal cleavage/methylation domain-containing protein [Candidatus Omnitrophota bacterium]
MMIKMNRKGFTLVEIMIVVAIIGLLAAIAIPNFVRARTRAQQEACIANLKQIEGAIQIWAVDLNQADTAVPAAWSALTPNYIRTLPACPGGGAAYALVAPSARPTCNIAGHTLP